MNKPITKTLIASALILVLAVSFVACGGRGNKPPVSTDPSTTDAANIIPDITDDNTDTDTVPETDKDGTTNEGTDNTTTTKKVDNTTTTKKKTDNTTTTKKKVNNTTTTKKKTDTTTTTKKNNTEPGTQAKRVRIMDWCTTPGITNVDHGSGEYSKAGYEFPKMSAQINAGTYDNILTKMEYLGYCTEAEANARYNPQTPGTGGTAIDWSEPGIKF